ncbi:MAG: hypothetical protein ABEH64_14205, partial [Salinirussus sp.]
LGCNRERTATNPTRHLIGWLRDCGTCTAFDRRTHAPRPSVASVVPIHNYGTHAYPPPRLVRFGPASGR